MDAKNFFMAEQIKKAYQAPVLMSFGKVAYLTQSGSNCDMNDNSTELCGAPPYTMQLMTGSDQCVKENISRIGDHSLGIGIYLFDYKSEYRDQWGHGRQFGVIAQEVEAVMPEAVHLHPDGYKMVDYRMLGIFRSMH